MSAIDGECKGKPLVLLLGGGDLSEPLLAKLLESPSLLVFILPVLLRLNRPMTW